jgi:hypothetical protein
MSEFQDLGSSQFLEEGYLEGMLTAALTVSVLLQPLITYSLDPRVAMTLGKIWLPAASGATTKKVIARWRKWVGP